MEEFTMSNPLNYTHEVRKVDLQKYKDAYTNELRKRFLRGAEMSVEEVRRLIYGYTFTEEYSTNPACSILSINFWYNVIDKAEREEIVNLPEFYSDIVENPDDICEEEFEEIIDRASDIADMIHDAIYSTGDGKTPKTAFCVIDICQAHEILSRLFGRDIRQINQVPIAENIECITFRSKFCGADAEFKAYFEIVDGK